MKDLNPIQLASFDFSELPPPAGTARRRLLLRRPFGRVFKAHTEPVDIDCGIVVAVEPQTTMIAMIDAVGKRKVLFGMTAPGAILRRPPGVCEDRSLISFFSFINDDLAELPPGDIGDAVVQIISRNGKAIRQNDLGNMIVSNIT